MSKTETRRHFVVVGCGRMGAALADQLFRRGCRVTVLDRDDQAFRNLPADFAGRMMQGDVLEQQVLRRAGLDEADGAAVMTSSDAVNAVVGRVAREHFGVPRVVLRNYQLRWLALHQSLGVEVISSSAWAAQQAEELLAEPRVRRLLEVGDGTLAVAAMEVPSSWAGRRPAEVLPPGALPVALSRGDRHLLPDAATVLAAGDRLLFSGDAAAILALKAAMAADEAEEAEGAGA